MVKDDNRDIFAGKSEMAHLLKQFQLYAKAQSVFLGNIL